MPATPAEVANDLAAQATYFAKRDDDIARLCRDAARLIRGLTGGQQADGLAFGPIYRDVLTRLQTYNGRPRPSVESQIDKSLYRAQVTLTDLVVGWQ